jgi:hypothetical protein
MMPLVDAVADQAFASIKVTTLVLYDPQDEVIDVEAIQRRMPSTGGPLVMDRFVSAAPSHHVIAGDILSPSTTGPVTDRIEVFLRDALTR